MKINPSNAPEVKQLNDQLNLMNSKLSQSKSEANDLKEEINGALNSKANNLFPSLDSLDNKVKNISKNISNFGSKITKAFSSKTIGNQISSINKNLNRFKNRITQMISAIAIFNLLNQGLTALRDGFISLLNTNDEFNSSLNQIKANLMTAFAPIYNACLPAINTLMNALKAITGTIATFVASIFGISLDEATNQAKNLSNALDNTAKSGEEASGSLASFDKLEVVGNNSNSSSSSNTNGTNIDYSGAITANSKLLSILNQIKSLISSGDWGGLAQMISESFVNGCDSIAKKIKSINWTGIGESISDFLTNIDFSGMLTGLVNIFGEAILAFQDLFLAIDWATTLANFSQGLRDAIFKLTDYISQIQWSAIGQKLSDAFLAIDWSGLGISIINLIWTTLQGLLDLILSIDWSQVGQKLSTAVHDWITTIIEMFQETDWVQLGMDIVDAIIDFISNVDWLQLGIDILTGLGNGVVAAIEFVIGCFSSLLSRILEFFGIHSPSTVFADMGKNIMQGLIDGIKGLLNGVLSIFSDLWNNLKSGAQGAWNGIVNVFSSVASFFKNIFSNAWTAVKNVFSTGGKIFDGIKDGIVTAFKNIVNKIIDGINKVVKIPFDGINSALQRIKNISILGVSPFTWLPTISAPQIPHLAEGTVIPPRQEFAAILGDQKHGTNIEAPLETIKQANREVMEEFLTKLLSMNSEEREIVLKNWTFNLQCGNTQFGKIVLQSIRLLEKELGKPLLLS